MRILHVFPFFSIKHGGGTSDLVYKIANAQAEEGHDVTIWTGSHNFDSQLADSLKNCEVRMFRSYLNFGFYLMPGLGFACVRDLKDFDVIHLHLYRSFQNVMIWAFASIYSIPYVLDAHGSVPLFVNKRFLKRIFDATFGKLILKSSAEIVAETPTGVQQYVSAGIDGNRVKIISPPFETNEFERLPEFGKFRSIFGLHDRKIIMFLGRIHHIKGLDILARGFRELSKTRDDVMLVFVGSDDGFLQELEVVVSDLGIKDKTLFVGFLQGQKKLQALIDADVVVQTSRYEEGAWAPFEAVLSGTPIVVTDNSGAGEDVAKIDAGYIAKFEDEVDLAEKLNYVLNNASEAKKKTMKAKKYIQDNLSFSSKLKEYMDLYSGVIENKSGQA